MKLTKQETIDLCIGVYTWVAVTGKHKELWPGWKTLEYGHITSCCFLCEYAIQQLSKSPLKREWWNYCQFCLLPGDSFNHCVRIPEYIAHVTAVNPAQRILSAEDVVRYLRKLKEDLKEGAE